MLMITAVLGDEKALYVNQEMPSVISSAFGITV